MIVTIKKTLFFILSLFIMAQSTIAANITEDFKAPIASRWMGDTDRFKTENGRLRSDCDTEKKKQYIAIKSYDIKGAEWIISGEMFFPVSSSNFLRIYIASDKQNPTLASNGYYIQIGSKEKNIAFRRIKTNNHQTIAKGEDNRLEGESLRFTIRLTRDTDKGKFILQSKINDEKEWRTECECIDNTTTISLYFALEPHYTKTRADKFYFDRVTIKSDYKDTTKPRLMSYFIHEEQIETYWNIPLESLVPLNKTLVKDIAIEGKKAVINLSRPIGTDLQVLLLGRATATNGQFAPATPIPIVRNETVRAGDIIINEILYNPPKGVSEFIELKNISGHAIDISTLYLAIGKNEYPLSDAGSVVVPNGGFVLVSKNIKSVCAYYDCGKCAVSSPEKLAQLANTGGDIVLRNEDGAEIDRVAYEEAMHHAMASETKGRSVCRISDGNGRFVSSSDANRGATPGKENLIEKKGRAKFELREKAVTKTTPKAKIAYNLENEGMQTDIFVYDKGGRKVRTICQTKLLAGMGEEEWDGKDDSGQWLPINPYIVVCEAYGMEGERIRERFVCVLGEHE